MKHQINVGYFISEGFHSIFTHGLMSFAAVCMIVACLLIMGSFSLVAVNVGNMLGDLEAENEFFAYVDETIPQEQVQALGKKLKAVPNVSEITFISKEEAKADFAKKYAESETADVFQDLPDEVYRDRYSIHVVDIEQFGETVSAVEAMKADGVAKVRAESDVATGFVVVRNIASGVAVILILILVVVSLFIIANTIKLGTFTRRDEISIMKMCGATNGFIRWPFVFEGIMLGICGAVLAFFLQWGVYGLIARAVATSDTIKLISVLPFKAMAMRVLGIFSATGLVVGVGGSMLAIRKFLQV
ncbi:MAG: permease-like cell division protein FtsX [Pseudoflavonifractor sp.]